MNVLFCPVLVALHRPLHLHYTHTHTHTHTHTPTPHTPPPPTHPPTPTPTPTHPHPHPDININVCSSTYPYEYIDITVCSLCPVALKASYTTSLRPYCTSKACKPRTSIVLVSKASKPGYHYCTSVVRNLRTWLRPPRQKKKKNCVPT